MTRTSTRDGMRNFVKERIENGFRRIITCVIFGDLNPFRPILTHA